MEDVSSVGKVILGAVARAARSGYEIKQLVDRSTRFFWAASYGQIYPELARLEEAGLINGESDPKSGRKRRVYRLTPQGREALRRWLDSEDAAYEVRDEGLLKLFFAGAFEPAKAREVLATLRRAKQETLDRLREVQGAVPADAPELAPSLLCLDYGIGVHAWTVDWCDRTARRLDRAARAEREEKR